MTIFTLKFKSRDCRDAHLVWNTHFSSNALKQSSRKDRDDDDGIVCDVGDGGSGGGGHH